MGCFSSKDNDINYHTFHTPSTNTRSIICRPINNTPSTNTRSIICRPINNTPSTNTRSVFNNNDISKIV